MIDSDAWVLEIFRQDQALKMSLFQEKELASTLRQYSLCAVSFPEIDKLAQEVTAILNKVDNKHTLQPDLIKGLRKTGQLLWDHLLTKPVKEKLRAKQDSALILSIDEELISIPWELLYNGDNFLCLGFNLGRLVRTKKETSQPEYRSLRGKLSMLILANPTSDLKSAYLEGINIRNQFDRKRNLVHIDFKSTNIDKLYVKKRLHDYDLVHFAGHCEYDLDKPQDSGWVLSDGAFTVQDILAMGSTVSLPTLVFSNACHSAVSADNLMSADYQQENYSLAQAFLFSGVRHYIGAIRKIEDPMSLGFAREFYAQLISGRSVGESVRLGRLKLIKEYGANCIHWMSYLLYGDPAFVLFKTKVAPPPIKRKISISKYKKRIFASFLAIATIVIGVFFYKWLPTLNPDNYFLFARSQKLFQKGENQEVISLCSQIIGKDPLFLAVYPLLADTYRRLGDGEQALKYYFDYAMQSERKSDKKNLASAYIGIGWTYYLQGEYPKAFDFYNKALASSKEGQDKLAEADVLGKLAVWYIDKQDYEKALELLTKSSEINRERQYIHKHRYNLACDYFNLGLVFMNKDDYAAARKFYEKSFRLFEKMRLTHELSDCYFNLGEICLFEKQYQQALDYYRSGLKLDQAQGNKFNLVSDYIMIGELYVEMDNLTEAEKRFNQAVAFSKEINARPELAAAYYDLGLLYKKKGAKNRSREYFRQAQEIYSTIDTSRYQEIKRELLNLSQE